MTKRRAAEGTKLMQSPTEHVQYHRDGSIWAIGKMLDGQQTGYWERFRMDGTKMRSGTFKNGRQVGEWTTYDKSGTVYKITNFKSRETN